MSTKEKGMAQKYRLNVDPGVEHELTDAEVRDMRAMGFSVTPVGRYQPPAKQAAKPADEKKEG